MADTPMSYDDLQSYLTGSVINPTYDSSKHRLFDYGKSVFKEPASASEKEVIAFVTMLVTAYPDDEKVIAYAAAELDRYGIEVPLVPTDLSKGTYPDNATFVNEIREGAKIERAFVETRGTGYTYDRAATLPSADYTRVNGMNVAEYITTNELYKAFAGAVSNFAIKGSCMPATDGTPSPVQLYMQAAMSYELLLHSKKASELTDADKKQLEAMAKDMDVQGKELDKLGISRSKVHGYIATHVPDCAKDKPLYDGDRELTAEELKPANIKEKGLFDRYNVNRAQYNELYLKSLEAADNTARMDRLNKYPGFRRMVWEYQQQLASGKAPFVNPFLSAMLVESREETPTAPTAGGATATATGGAGGSVTVGDVIINGGKAGKGGTPRPKPPKPIAEAIKQIRAADTRYKKTLGNNTADTEEARTKKVSSTIARNASMSKQVGKIFAYLEDPSFSGSLEAIRETLDEGYDISRDGAGNFIVKVNGESYTHDIATSHIVLAVSPSEMTPVQHEAVVNNIYIADATRVGVNTAYRAAHSDLAIAEVQTADLLQSTYTDAATSATVTRSLINAADQIAAATALGTNTTQTI